MRKLIISILLATLAALPGPQLIANPSARVPADSIITLPDDMPEHVKTYLQALAGVSRRVARETGIYMPALLAISALESGWGESRLTREANNFFGIKAYNWTGDVYEKETYEHMNGALVPVMAKFRKYASAEDSFRDFALMMKTHPRYQWIFRIPCHDFENWAMTFQASDYQTDPEYASKIIQIIRKYHLYRFCYLPEWQTDGEKDK